MGTKRPSGTIFDTLSNINTSDRKLQPGGKISRDPSPRPVMTAQSERERDREDGRRRERECVKMRDKPRYKDSDPRERYYEKDQAPAPRLREREGGREWRERDKRYEDDRRGQGRPLSNLEKDSEREMERGMKKGDTFPRMRKGSPEGGRRNTSTNDVNERGERRQRERPKRIDADDWERERAWQRERERDQIRSRAKDEGRRPVEDVKSGRERYQGSDQDRRREGGDPRDRLEWDVSRKRETPKPNVREREARAPSPNRRRDKEIYPDRREKEKAQNEGRRDTRSEGDSDERERRRERERDREREELIYQQSKSEGDNKGRTEREKYRAEDRQRYRDRDREVDQSRRRRVEKERERYREEDREREKWRDDRYREYDQRRRKEREADPRRDDTTGKRSRAQNETAPRAPPRAQSSSELSSDMDSEMRRRSRPDSFEEREPDREGERGAEEQRNSERSQKTSERGESAEQRRMWLEPQRGKNSKREFEDTERHSREKEWRMESQAEWEKEGRRVKEEPDERYSDQNSYRGRHGERSEQEKESEGVSVDGEEVGEVWRELDKGGKGHLSDSDGGIEDRWQRDAEGENVTDNTEESDREEEGGSDYWARSGSEEGGSETGWKQERDRMLSGEDGFVTVSSGGDEEDDREEEEFEDCQEFWEGGGSRDGHSPVASQEKDETEEEMDDEEEEEGREKRPKYVFCVIGQTLPRSGTNKVSHVDQKKGVEGDDESLESSHRGNDDATQQPQSDLRRNDDINNQDAGTSEVDIRYRASSEHQSAETEEGAEKKVEHPYAEIGTIKRDSQTEKLLIKWREKNKDGLDREGENDSPVPDNPYADIFSQVDLKQIQPILDEITSGAMSPEEVEAIRIRMSGAWSMSEEPKRHSQAPHLKWAKNVVREILGRSEEHALEESNKCVQEEEVEEGTGESVLRSDQEHSEPKLEEEEEGEEPLEVEGLRDDEDDRSRSWGEVELRNVLETIDRRKRNSRFFNAAQLYQQYSEAAQNFEILRQARSSDVISVSEDAPRSPAPSPPPARRPLPPLPSVPHPHSLAHTGSITSIKSLPVPTPSRREGRPTSPRLSISLTQSATLWRELPGVRNSTELEELTEDQRRLQEVRFEVVTSEASYCRSLDIVVEHFVKCKQLGSLLTTQDRNWLFSRLADVRAISHSFLSKLEERVESHIMEFTVCDIIARHCQRFKMVYVPYLTNQSYQDATYQRLMNENPGFKRIVEKLERSPVCQRLPLRSFLVLPFQRITRIKLLVQNIVKRTTPGTPEATQAIKALKLLEKLIQESNDSITQMKSIESLVSLSAKVDFECRTLPLISQSRRLVREGPVTELMDFSLKDTERNIYLHLFTDYLLVSLQKEGGRFTVIDHAPVSELRAENCRVKLHSLQKNLIRLHMSNRALLLRTDTQSDKLRWISALSRPHAEIDFSAAQDFTQMQCIRAFIAQQPDELSLEKADIILVHQQSSDHWVEGTRLSDRHRGWIPESHLETISNSRVRQHNLSDALKLRTATAAV